MATKNYTQLVTPNTCLGDSLATFNANFSALDEGLRWVPNVVPGVGTAVSVDISEQNHNTVKVSTKNSFVYHKSFEYLNGPTAKYITIGDGTTIPVTEFPYVSSSPSINPSSPFGTFSTISLTDSPPTVTLFWTASGSDNLTVYATNSSISSADVGPIGFNGPVTALLSSGNILYVGGEFTTVGNVENRKFCAINLNSGSYSVTLGYRGVLLSNPLSSDGGLGLNGTVHAIAEYNNLLIVGGSFNSISKGRGLTIIDRSTGIVYPFHVNGTVYDIMVVGTDLYIAGEFDFINYSAQATSLISNMRSYTNGIAKISLALINTGPSSINKSFGEAVQMLFIEPVKINTLANKDGAIYIGGDFEIGLSSGLVARNLAILNSDGTKYSGWNPIVDGEVFTIDIDGEYVYVGGAIRSFHTSSQYYTNPRTNDATTIAYNAIAFKVPTPATQGKYDPSYIYGWKPKFNGPVTKFVFHDSSLNSYVYCHGRFNQVNSLTVGHAAAVHKAYVSPGGVIGSQGESYVWNVDLQSSPDMNNQGLLRYNNSIIIGGSFTKVNNKNRFYLARVNGINETLITTALSSIVWGIGAQVCSPGMGLNMDFTTYTTVSSYPKPVNIINQTVLPLNPLIFKGYSEGDLLRFFINRPKDTGTFYQPVQIVGWKVDFN